MIVWLKEMLYFVFLLHPYIWLRMFFPSAEAIVHLCASIPAGLKVSGVHTYSALFMRWISWSRLFLVSNYSIIALFWKWLYIWGSIASPMVQGYAVKQWIIIIVVQLIKCKIGQHCEYSRSGCARDFVFCKRDKE